MAMISIIIPAYNEEKRISSILRNYSREFQQDSEIIVVCDGKDKTAEIVKNQNIKNVRCLEFQKKLGKGGAIKKGVEAAEGDIICFVDCDDSAQPSEMKKLIERLKTCDIAISSRYTKNSVVFVKPPLLRRLASKALNVLFVRGLFGLPLSDSQCGCKAFKAGAIKNLVHVMKSTGFEFDVELLWLAKKFGYKIEEVPITWSYSDLSTFSYGCISNMFFSLLGKRFSSPRIKSILSHRKFVRPIIASRIIYNIFKYNVLKRHVLRSVEFAVTYGCQCKCKFCYAAELTNFRKKDISTEEIKRIWDQCIDLGAIHVNITGGEPLLRRDICDVIKAFNPDKTIVSLVTNGLLLNKEMVHKLKAAGLNTLQISIDSSHAEEHDSSRGVKGCYDTALKGAEYAKEAGINVCLSTVPTRKSIKTGEIWKILNIAEQMDTFLLLNIPKAIGRWKNEHDQLLTAEDWKVVEMLMSNPRCRMNTMFNFRLKRGCPAGEEKFYITSYGEITPCDQIFIKFGNVNEPIKEVWRRMYSFCPFSQHSDICLSGRDKDFIKKYMEILPPEVPLAVEEHPVHRETMEKSLERDLSFMKDNILTKHKNQIVKEFIPSSTKNILNIGCGSGSLDKALSDEGYKVTVLDNSDLALAAAKKATDKIHVLKGDVSNLSLDRKFDCIICLDVLEHVRDHERALKNINNMLNENGTFILGVPVHEWLWNPHDVDLGHHRRYSKHSVVELLKKNNFVVEKTRYWNLIGVVPSIYYKITGKTPRYEDINNRIKDNKFIDAVGYVDRHISRPFGLSFFVAAKKQNNWM